MKRRRERREGEGKTRHTFSFKEEIDDERVWPITTEGAGAGAEEAAGEGVELGEEVEEREGEGVVNEGEDREEGEEVGEVAGAEAAEERVSDLFSSEGLAFCSGN